MYSIKYWVSLFAVILFMMPVKAESPSGELNRIKNNYTQSLLSSNAEASSLVRQLTGITPEKTISDQAVAELHQHYPFDLKKIEAYLQKIRPDGSFSDINYQDTKRSGWDAKNHAERVLELAKLYYSQGNPYYHSEKIAAVIHSALNYWFTQKPVCLNWWYNQIGVPKTFGAAFILLENMLTEKEKAGAIQVMENSKFGMTGQNKVWLAGNVLIRALLQNDYSLVKSARDTIFSEIVTNQPEGIQSDWSFHQHGPQQQLGNYGLSFLSGMSFYSCLFVGTSMALHENQLATLSSFINEGFRWIIWHSFMDINALNRQLFHNASIHKAFTVAFSAVELAKSGSPACREAASNILKNNFSPDVNGNTFVGQKHFWESDMTIHRRPQWMASVKMSSQRVIGTELVNEDNLKGFYMGDGATYTYVKGDEYLNVFPFWDWRKIPGVTAYESELPLPRFQREKSRNEAAFVGGVTDGQWGMTAMDLNRNGLRAHKSWIFTDRFVLCLGSGIQSDSSLTVTTSIDQRLKKKELLHLNGKTWNTVTQKSTFGGKDVRFFHDQTGYIILNAEKTVATAEKRTGRWHDFMGMYDPEDVQGEVISLHLDHGTAPRSASYEYLILPATSKEYTASWNSSSLRILQNDLTAQIVAMPQEKAYFVTAYQPVRIKLDNNLNFAANTPGIYMIRQTKEGLRLWYADPTHTQIKASAEINGKKTEITLPSGNRKGVSTSFKISGNK